MLPHCLFITDPLNESSAKSISLAGLSLRIGMEKATFHTNGFISGSTMRWVIIISQGSLFLLVPVFALGLHPIFAAALLLITMYVGFQMVTGKVTYVVDETGIIKDVEPTMFKNFWKKKSFQYFSWDKVKSFKAGTDASRDLEEFEFLTIYMTNGQTLELNTKKSDEAAFREFERVFRHYVVAVGEEGLPDSNQPVSVQLAKEAMSDPEQRKQRAMHKEAETPVIKHRIREKPNFYQTVFAKVLTIFFVILCIVLALVMAFSGLGSFSSLFRLGFVLVPGTIYLFYRVFVKKE